MLKALILSAIAGTAFMYCATGALAGERELAYGAGLATAAEFACSTLQTNDMGDALLDSVYNMSKEDAEMNEAYVQGGIRFRAMQTEMGEAPACLSVLKTMPAVFEVTMNGVTMTGEQFIAAAGL